MSPTLINKQIRISSLIKLGKFSVLSKTENFLSKLYLSLYLKQSSLKFLKQSEIMYLYKTIFNQFRSISNFHMLITVQHQIS